MGPYKFKPEDAFRFAASRGTKVTQRGTELIFDICPYCKKRNKDDKKKFSINLDTGQFHCFRASCNARGNMITLAKDFNFDLGKDVMEYYAPKREFHRPKQREKKVVPNDPALRYLDGRGISESVAKEYEITTKQDEDNILIFPFFDEKGIYVTAKYRKTDFDKEKDSNKEWFMKDCKPILFGMYQCKNFDRLIITEGQLDSLSVATAGIDNAVSVPGGVNNFTWIPYCWDWVVKFREIVVFGDYENGHITLLDDIKQRFPNKIKHVREVDYQGCKDANEILQKYGEEAIRHAVENAIEVPIENVKPLEEVEEVNIYEMETLHTGIKDLDDLLFGGLPFGSVCLLGGKRGDGKSTFASQIMVNAVEQGYVTFAYSGEMPNGIYRNWFEFQVAGPEKIMESNTESGNIKRYISLFNEGKIRNWYRGKAFIYDNQIIGDNEPESIIDTITHCIMQYGVRVILIDNLMTAMFAEPTNGMSSKYDMQSSFVQKLTRLALEYNVLILLVAHMRKNSSGDSNDDISGSGDITNFAGITMSYNRDDKLLDSQRKLILAKNRLFGRTNFDGIVLDYDEKSKRIYGKNDDLHRIYNWDTDDDGFVQVEDDEDIQFK